MGKKVEKTRANGTMSESAYFSRIRSILRRGFMYWKPMMDALKASSRQYKGENKLQKLEYQCSQCGQWYKRKEVNIDHIEDCGELRSYEDIVPFIQRLTKEGVENFQVLCKTCHQEKTNLARLKRKNDKK